MGQIKSSQAWMEWGMGHGYRMEWGMGHGYRMERDIGMGTGWNGAWAWMQDGKTLGSRASYRLRDRPSNRSRVTPTRGEEWRNG